MHSAVDEMFVCSQALKKVRRLSFSLFCSSCMSDRNAFCSLRRDENDVSVRMILI